MLQCSEVGDVDSERCAFRDACQTLIYWWEFITTLKKKYILGFWDTLIGVNIVVLRWWYRCDFFQTGCTFQISGSGFLLRSNHDRDVKLKVHSVVNIQQMVNNRVSLERT